MVGVITWAFMVLVVFLLLMVNDRLKEIRDELRRRAKEGG